jgi:hypothetical protein
MVKFNLGIVWLIDVIFYFKKLKFMLIKLNEFIYKILKVLLKNVVRFLKLKTFCWKDKFLIDNYDRNHYLKIKLFISIIH